MIDAMSSGKQVKWKDGKHQGMLLFQISLLPGMNSCLQIMSSSYRDSESHAWPKGICLDLIWNTQMFIFQLIN